jgi:hypothetical protein
LRGSAAGLGAGGRPDGGPIRMNQRRCPGSRRRPQQPTTQDPRLENASRDLPGTATITATSRRCDDRLKPVNSGPGSSPAGSRKRDSARRGICRATNETRPDQTHPIGTLDAGLSRCPASIMWLPGQHDRDNADDGTRVRPSATASPELSRGAGLRHRVSTKPYTSPATPGARSTAACSSGCRLIAKRLLT